MPDSKDLARWTNADEIVAHGLGIELDPIEMEGLMHCLCAMPAFDTFDICGFCDRSRFVKTCRK